MAGEIGVDSEPGVGSCFWIELALPLERHEQQFDPKIFTENYKNRRVLVLEDNAVYGDILKLTLGQWGIDADVSDSFDQASDFARKVADDGNSYDVVICSFEMRERDGLEFLKRIREEAGYEATPFILTSSVGLPVETRQDVEALSAMFLLKPVQQLRLFDALATGWGLHRSDEVRHSEQIYRIEENETLAGDAPSLRILVTDENVVNQELVKTLLGIMGHRVDVAANGQEALEALRQIPYDLLFMDVQVSETDGLEAIRNIRALGPRQANVPIIAMTANARKGDEELCLEAGMNAYLSKPIRKDKLAKAIDSILPLDAAL